MGAVFGVAGCALLVIAYVVAVIWAVVWAIVDLVNGHPHLILDVVILVLFVPMLLGANAAGSKKA